jgi:hypothetical protein
MLQVGIPYDWRQAPSTLEGQSGLFTAMKIMAEELTSRHNQRVRASFAPCLWLLQMPRDSIDLCCMTGGLFPLPLCGLLSGIVIALPHGICCHAQRLL